MTLTELLGKNAEYYKSLFNSWVAIETHIDEDHDIWRLQSPEYKNEFVAMYRDGYRLFIYGDYGNLIFDRMTWQGSPHNLSYNDLGYQMEKLSHDSLASVKIFDEKECLKDIVKWFEDRIEQMSIKDAVYNEIIDFLKNISLNNVEQFIDEIVGNYRDKVDKDELEEIENDLFDVKDLLVFTKDATLHAEEYEWIAWLRQSNLDDFEEACESNLWDAGKCIHQRFYVNLYAMQILSEKLKEQEAKPENIIKRYFTSGNWLNADFEDFTGMPISADILEKGIMSYIEDTIAQMPAEKLTVFAEKLKGEQHG